MTKQKAVQLQNEWASKGNPACTPHILRLLETEEQTYLTGEYACTVCGAVIAKEGLSVPASEEE
jgi:hypothetical protein